jgi:hypothetical protein
MFFQKFQPVRCNNTYISQVLEQDLFEKYITVRATGSLRETMNEY